MFQWYYYGEYCPSFRSVPDLYFAVVPLDNIFTNRQAQPCALAGVFSGKERLKKILLHFPAESASRIGKFNQQMLFQAIRFDCQLTAV